MFAELAFFLELFHKGTGSLTSSDSNWKS